MSLLRMGWFLNCDPLEILTLDRFLEPTVRLRGLTRVVHTVLQYAGPNIPANERPSLTHLATEVEALFRGSAHFHDARWGRIMDRLDARDDATTACVRMLDLWIDCLSGFDVPSLVEDFLTQAFVALQVARKSSREPKQLLCTALREGMQWPPVAWAYVREHAQRRIEWSRTRDDAIFAAPRVDWRGLTAMTKETEAEVRARRTRAYLDLAPQLLPFAREALGESWLDTIIPYHTPVAPKHAASDLSQEQAYRVTYASVEMANRGVWDPTVLQPFWDQLPSLPARSARPPRRTYGGPRP